MIRDIDSVAQDRQALRQHRRDTWRRYIDIRSGEFVALVGPSGCGKSTLLRMIAGLESITGGELYLGEDLVNDVAPRDRNIAMVFQNYALYPHLTVADNLGFAFKTRGVDKALIARRVDEVAATLGLSALLKRYPRQLSGGQRQRVAMGRAIIREPVAFLFDEPLSNLDARLRVQMRTEIKALHQRLRTTTVYVTHDQVEAMTMADRIVLLRDGRVEQTGSPLDLYDRPANTFVAGFIGSPAMNFVPGRLHHEGAAAQVLTEDGLRLPLAGRAEGPEGAAVLYGLRPEHFTIVPEGEGLDAEVVLVEPTGAETQIVLRLGPHELIAAFRDRIAAVPGERISVAPSAGDAHLFEAEKGLRLN